MVHPRGGLICPMRRCPPVSKSRDSLPAFGKTSKLRDRTGEARGRLRRGGRENARRRSGRQRQVTSCRPSGSFHGKPVLVEAMQMLELRDEKLGFAVTHDRQWFVTGDRREQKTLRRVDEDGLVAQCTMSVLPAQSVDRQTTLEQFVRDIKFALGKNFGEIAASEQWTNQHDERCLAAVVLGQVDGVPVQWRYYLLTPDNGGSRLSVVVTVQQDAIDRLGKIDRELVDRIDLLSSTEQSSETAQRELHTSVMRKK